VDGNLDTLFDLAVGAVADPDPEPDRSKEMSTSMGPTP